MTARVQVRPTKRHDGGFLIVGRDTLGRSVRIFTVTRSSADRIAAKVRDGLDIDTADFAR